MKNPFKQIKELENRIVSLEIKNEQLYELVIALARCNMLNPEILQEHYLERNKNLEYVKKMVGK